MKAVNDIGELRQRLALHEGNAREVWPSVPLGAMFQNAFPDGEFAGGGVHEFLPAAVLDMGALTGFVCAVLAQILQRDTGGVLLAAPAYHLSRDGAFCPLGSGVFGCPPDRFIQVVTPNSKDVLWALEEGLSSSAFAAVIGVLPENDRVYDFGASRRLAMRARETGVSALLVRNQCHAGGATAAQTRWSVASTPTVAQHWRGARLPGVGAPQWEVSLTKSKMGALGAWHVGWDHETFSFYLASRLADRAPLRTYGSCADTAREGSRQRFAAS